MVNQSKKLTRITLLTYDGIPLSCPFFLCSLYAIFFILKKEMASYLHTIDIGTPNTPLSLIEGVFLIPSKEVEKDTDIFMHPPRSNDTPRV